ncbi:hypothetical protein [Zoogloea sp.]|uniref:hypothetical protein n=1 Tax=Zoogloea sp. TaxID=49181 RepID=UPI0035B47E7C
MALPFYSPVMEPDAVRHMLRADGRTFGNAPSDAQIMLNPERRRAEFGISVVSAML